MGWSYNRHSPHRDGVVLRHRGFDRLAPSRKPHRLDLLGRGLLLWALERWRGVRHLCAPHESRLSPSGSGVLLAGEVDLGAGARPEPGVPAPPVSRRPSAVTPLAPG